MRPRPALIRLLVVLLLLQWGTAFGHCLRSATPASAAVSVEICTAEGLRHVTLPGEGGETGGDREAAPACPLCLGPAAAVLHAPGAMPGPKLVLVQAADPPPPPAPPPSPLPSPSCRPRAPPTS